MSRNQCDLMDICLHRFRAVLLTAAGKPDRSLFDLDERVSAGLLVLRDILMPLRCL